MSSLTARDYDRMLQLATMVFEASNAQEPWRLVGEEFLGSLFGADVFLFAEIDYAASTSQLVEALPGWAALNAPVGAVVHEALVQDHPFSWHYSRGAGSLAVTRISDLVPSRVWRATSGYATIRELFGTSVALALPVQAKPFRGLGIQRVDHDFSDRDVELARRLQPLLVAMDRHLRSLRRWRSAWSGEAQPRSAEEVAAALRITPRELTVLASLADGLTATAIARRLNISARTVGNHQASLYRKLGVTDRLSAVLRAQEHGLLPPPRPAPPAQQTPPAQQAPPAEQAPPAR
jgi:DNA-binding CsgD family transcriptional regulator